MNVYFRFYYNDFLSVLVESLNSENRQLEGMISNIIKNKPMEIYQDLKDYMPKWFMFHLMEVLYDMEKLDMQPRTELDGNSLRTYDYLDFLNYLLLLDVNFEDYVNYSASFDTSEVVPYRSYHTLFDRAVTNSVCREFEQYSKGLKTLANLSEFLKSLLGHLSSMKEGSYYIHSVTKVDYIR